MRGPGDARQGGVDVGDAEAGRLYAALGFTECAAYYENPVPGARYLRLVLDRNERD